MSKCSGLHCGGCRDGGSGSGAFGLALLIIVIAGIIGGNGAAIERGVSDVLAVVFWTGVGLGSAAVVGSAAFVGYRLRVRARTRARELQPQAPAMPAVITVQPAARPLTEPHRAAIEPRKSLPSSQPMGSHRDAGNRYSD